MPHDSTDDAPGASLFRQVTEDFWAAPQITPADVALAAELGVALILNNRPDAEEPGQPTGAEIKAAAEAAGLAYAEVPVDRTGLTMEHLDAVDAAREETPGRMLAFCRSGTRSTNLWAFVEARRGAEVDEIVAAAGNAGYNLFAQRPALEAVARSGR